MKWILGNEPHKLYSGVKEVTTARFLGHSTNPFPTDLFSVSTILRHGDERSRINAAYLRQEMGTEKGLHMEKRLRTRQHEMTLH